MRRALWFSGVTDIGNSAPASGLPVSQLIDFSVNTAFDLSEHALTRLRALSWVHAVNRRRGQRRIQLIVRCRELPAQYGGANCQEAFRAHLLTVLRGW